MLQRLYYVIGLLSCLLIGLGLCHSASLDRLRIGRDTRNISSHLFTPLNNSPNAEENEDNSTKSGKRFLDTFEEPEQAQARPVSEPATQEEDYGDVRKGGSWPPTPRFSDIDRFNSPARRPFNVDVNRGFDASHLHSFGNGPGSFSGYYDPRMVTRPSISQNAINTDLFMIPPNGLQQITTNRRFGGSSFGGPSFSGPSSGGPSFGGSRFGGPIFGEPSPGGGPSNNYYRSESYSYSSDGMGAPQIQQSVYDSRLGLQNSQNF